MRAAALAAGLLRFRHELFVAAGGHESSGVRRADPISNPEGNRGATPTWDSSFSCDGRTGERNQKLEVNLTDFTPR